MTKISNTSIYKRIKRKKYYIHNMIGLNQEAFEGFEIAEINDFIKRAEIMCNKESLDMLEYALEHCKKNIAEYKMAYLTGESNWGAKNV